MRMILGALAALSLLPVSSASAAAATACEGAHGKVLASASHGTLMRSGRLLLGCADGGRPHTLARGRKVTLATVTSRSGAAVIDGVARSYDLRSGRRLHSATAKSAKRLLLVDSGSMAVLNGTTLIAADRHGPRTIGSDVSAPKLGFLRTVTWNDDGVDHGVMLDTSGCRPYAGASYDPTLVQQDGELHGFAAAEPGEATHSGMFTCFDSEKIVRLVGDYQPPSTGDYLVEVRNPWVAVKHFTASATTVSIVNARTLKPLRDGAFEDPGTTAARHFLTSTGNFAWSLTSTPSIRTLTAAGITTLDAGFTIDPTSLSFNNDTLQWRNGKTIKTAPLP